MRTNLGGDMIMHVGTDGDGSSGCDGGTSS
jgi:hypothetical protein